MNLWLKIKIWTKMLALGFVVIYLFFFIYKNADDYANVWLWYAREYHIRVLTLTFCTFLAGILVTLLTRTIVVTIRQIKDATRRARQVQMEKDLADMKEKAARLQTRPAAEPARETGSSERP